MSTFNASMMKAVATTMSTELRTLYNVGAAKGLDCWGPVININHDPRWGRNGEAGSEDPLLKGVYATQWALGFQSGSGTKSGFIDDVRGVFH
jgi:beta-glucosidase-like glycosyl hydrolase